jgi:hypothetical protein
VSVVLLTEAAVFTAAAAAAAAKPFRHHFYALAIRTPTIGAYARHNTGVYSLTSVVTACPHVEANAPQDKCPGKVMILE